MEVGGCVMVDEGAQCDVVAVPVVAVLRGVVVCVGWGLCKKSLVNEEKRQKNKENTLPGLKTSPIQPSCCVGDCHFSCSTHGLTVDEELVNKKKEYSVRCSKPTSWHLKFCYPN